MRKPTLRGRPTIRAPQQECVNDRAGADAQSGGHADPSTLSDAAAENVQSILTGCEIQQHTGRGEQPVIVNTEHRQGILYRRLHQALERRAGLSRTMGRRGLRRATSLNPARSYMDLAPNHMESSLDRPGLSTGYASSRVAPCFLA